MSATNARIQIRVRVRVLIMYIRYTNNPILESGTLGANIYRARNVW